MLKKTLFAVLILSSSFTFAYSMDWKDLHGRADKLSLAQARSASSGNSAAEGQDYILGLVYLNLHQDQAAGEVFNKLLAAHSGLIEARWGNAEILRRRHNLSAAESELNAIIKIDPQFAPALISLAYIKYIQMDFRGSADLAAGIIRRGREQADLSNYARAYALYAGAKGMLAYYGGFLSKAIDGLAVKSNLDKAQKLQPDAPAVLFGLGSYYLLAPPIAGGNPAKAQSYLEQAVKADPFLADAFVRLGQLAKFNGDRKKYDFYLQKALEIDPQNELAEDVLGGKCKFICLGR